jgi:ABC-type amino acid transport substrate-binding protein
MKKTLLALSALFAVAGAAHAQANDTLAKIKSTGKVVIGTRDSSAPLAYTTGDGKYTGYHVEICNRIVDAIKNELKMPNLTTEYTLVTSQNRIPLVTNGTVDLECGSTTNNVERPKQVGFSPTIFVSGTKLMVRKGSPIKSFRDLAGQRVVVTAGTTNEKAMRDLAARFKIAMTLVSAADHAASFAQLTAGQADAFATDDVLLYGLLAQHKLQGAYAVVGEYLSYDPYGIMYRKGDTQLAQLVGDTLAQLAADGEIERRYERWFLRRLPQSGVSLDLPMSAQLQAIVEAMGTRGDERAVGEGTGERP